MLLTVHVESIGLAYYIESLCSVPLKIIPLTTKLILSRMPSLRGFSLLLLLQTLLSSPVAASSFVPRSSSIAQKPSVFGKKACLAVTGGSEEEGAPQHPILPDAEAALPIVPAPTEAEAIATPATSLMGPNAPPPGLLRKNIPSFPWYRLPNYLTYARCLAIPALMVLFYMPDQHVLTGVLFGFASFTDWLDGYLARRWDITSAFGAFLDPVADKLMVSTALILLAGRYGKAVSIPSSIILAREIAVSALREWMAQRGQRNAVQVGFQGKVKTALTMVALTVLLLVPTTQGSGFLDSLRVPGLVMLDLSALVTVTSGSVYFLAAAPVLFEK
jgi:CDP-diacylglycerol--glycerol-3-phosphate 3-phosphatidyltransferase